MRHPVDVSTLFDLLVSRADAGTARGYTFLVDGERDELRLSHADLLSRAQAIGATLQRRGLAGERVLLLYAPGLDYVCGFFGCLAGPAVAVPTYPPDPGRLERSVGRLVGIVEDCRPAAALTTAAVLAALQPLLQMVPALGRLQWIATDALDTTSADWHGFAARADDTAFLQYTSGSTGAPKGVVLTHANLLANSASIHSAFGHGTESRGLVWLPPYHDMGLIGGILQPLYGGFDVALMSPLHFLARPMRWLEAVSRHRATTSGGPNFAYDLCVRKSTPEERAALDLSSWEVAFNGAEPIRVATLNAFAEAFAVAGFRREAFLPCYGLAESTLLVSSAPRLRAPRALRASREELTAGRVAHPGGGDRELVSCGELQAGGRLVVVDLVRRTPCGEGEVGELWLAGPSVAASYHEQPELSAEVFGARLADGSGPFLRTGDLGFLHGGELYVAGRLKDLIIVRGKNHHPPDLEQTAERCHPAIRRGCVAAFQCDGGGRGDDRVVLVAEVARQVTDDLDELCRAVRRGVAEEHEVQLGDVLLVPPGTVPKTSSGKIERHSCRRAYLAGALVALAQSRMEEPADEPAAAAAPPAIDADGQVDADALRRYLVGQLARALRLAPGDVDPRQPATALGLDSLTAVELQTQLERDLGVPVSAVEWLRGASVEQVAALVEQTLRQRPPAPPAPAPAPTDPPLAEYPLSWGQRSLWFLQLVAPESAAYNLWIAARLAGRPDEDALRAACERLALRHPSLRARVVLRDGRPWQRTDPGPLDLEVVDASEWTDAELRERMTAEAHRPFDLAAGVFRVRLYRRQEDGAVLFAAHHLAVDLWSAGVLVEEVLGRSAPGRDAAAATASAPLPFAGHVADEARYLEGDEAARDLAFWRAQLDGAPPLELPLDAPRPPRQSFRGGAVPVDLEPDLLGRVRTLARQEGTTPYAVLLAAFAAFLHRITGQEDLVVGSPTAGRHRAAAADTVGYFVNPVAIRTDVSEQPTFRQLVGRVRSRVLDALEHARLPFALLLERLGLARTLDRPPLFQALFALERAPTSDALAGLVLGDGGPVGAGALALAPLALEPRSSAFDLALVLFEDGPRAAGSLRYDTALFGADTAARWARQLGTLLEALVDHPDRRVADAPVDGPDVGRRCLVEWSETGDEPAGEALFHQLVEAQARRAPRAVAVAMDDRALSYAELDARADALAATLQRAGVGPERVVAVLLERSIDQPAALLAVLKAGGTYLPLDPALPDARLRLVIDDAGAACLLTSRALAGRLTIPRAVLVDDEHAGRPAPVELSGEGAAYVIYTSGSTGRPKGVVVSHASAVNLAAAQRRTFGVAPGNRALQYASCAFDASFFEVSLALTAGAALVVVPARGVLPGPELVRILREQRVTTVTLPPTVLAALDPAELPGIQTVISAGEACPNALVERWGSGRRFFNAYGPTEATVWSTVAELTPDDLDAARRPPIGRPVAGVRAYVLDGRLRPVPVGALGELCIGGRSVARGYLGRPDLTADRFVPDPFAAAPGARLYRTGDLARWRDDGALELFGRADDQLKIRGFRVEPGEVEAALREHAEVADCCVVGRPDRHGALRLVAYVTGGAPPLDAVRAFLRERGLPEPFLPAAVVPLDGLPRTVSGKVDRRALPEPSEPSRAGPAATPANDLERTLLEVFRDALGHADIGTRDHFFEVLGGNSLGVVRACALLKERAGIDLDVTAPFEHPTIEALARHLAGAGRAQPTARRHGERADARAAALRQRAKPRT